jgi:hypothetical protein
MTSSLTETFDVVLECGSRSLVTRDQGRALLDKLETRLESSASIRVELAQAEAFSPSFADEFFGGLAEHLGLAEFSKRVRVHCPSEAWRILIQKVLAHRRSHPKATVTLS